MSKLSTYLRCEQLYEYRYMHFLEPKEYIRPLQFGDMGHQILAKYYQCLKDKTFFDFNATVQDIVDSKEAEVVGANAMQAFQQDISALRGMIAAYMKFHQADQKWNIEGVELTVQANSDDVPHFNGFTPKAILDALIEVQGKYWIVEHKFLSRVDSGLIDTLPLNLQVNMYYDLVNRWLKNTGKDGLTGVIFNIVKKPSKRLKKNQTVDAYIKELHDDYLARSGELFVRIPVILTDKWQSDYKQLVAQTTADIVHSERTQKFKRCITQCTSMGRCSFIDLCVHGESAMNGYRKSTRR